MMRWIITVLFSFAMNAASYANLNQTEAPTPNPSSNKTKWGYIGNIGPERWAQLSPDFKLCAVGKQQSPINIKKKVTPSSHQLTFHYSKAPLVVMDNGLTTLNIAGKQTIFNDGHSLQLNFAPSTTETIEFAGKTYQLVELHFHSPSENRLRNQGFPLEIHFVHQDNNGNVLVIGVWVVGGKENKTISKILANLPTVEGVAKTVPNVYVNPTRLLPKSLSYYQFMGSLTTPPCIEGIQWVMLTDVIQATPAQIVTIRQVSNGTNARPVQPLYKREVSFAE